ncbi:MAG TPA: hypothetical protein VKE51_32235 [Vicinamibacterales bacterium]|nr:hypothetical protein [Vicinamibacterales bacterium]
MRFLSSIVRALTTAGGVALVWTASVSPAYAAPVVNLASACEAQPTAVRKLPRHTKSFGGPLKPATPLQFGLTDPTARLRRATRTNFHNEPAAIQSDVQAARIEEDGRPVPSLLLVGLLPHAADIRPRSPTFCPRSPRGPPSAA